MGVNRNRLRKANIMTKRATEFVVERPEGSLQETGEPSQLPSDTTRDVTRSTFLSKEAHYVLKNEANEGREWRALPHRCTHVVTL